MFRALVAHDDTIEQIRELEKLEAAVKDPRKRVWLDLEGPKRDDLEFMEKKLGFHTLLLEDISNEKQRPKVESYENYLYVVVKTPDFVNFKQLAQLNMVLGPNYLVTVRSRQLPFLDEVWQRTEKNSSILTRGPDFVLYAILDVFVDGIFPVVNEFDAQLDVIEEKVFKEPQPSVIVKLFTLKRKLFATRRAVTPLRDVLTSLARHDTPLISKKNAVYFRDVYDHLIRLTESLDNAREIMTAAMEGYMSAVSNSLNVIMKKLTAITAIIMIPSLIAGIYGMNFSDITLYAMGSATISFMLMAAAVFILGVYFKLRGWL